MFTFEWLKVFRSKLYTHYLPFNMKYDMLET